MDPDEIRKVVLEVLGDVAPEIDVSDLEPDVEFRDQLELDSMDFLNFAIGLHERLGIEIPEEDYPQLASLDACVAYLEPLVDAGPSG